MLTLAVANGTVRAQADTVEAMDFDAEDETEQEEGARKEPLTQEAKLDHRHVAIDGILGIDLENAYGRMFRSVALEGAKHSAPRTAATAATRWRAGANRIWYREGAA